MLLAQMAQFCNISGSQTDSLKAPWTRFKFKYCQCLSFREP